MYFSRISDFLPVNKPRERLLSNGETSLSDVELLAIVLGSGGVKNSALDLANLILNKFDGFRGLLNADVVKLMEMKDIGMAKACCIKAMCEISMRMHFHQDNQRMKIISPKDVFNCVRKDLFSKNKECLYLLSLDSQKKLISKDLISVGTLNESLVHPREVFEKAFSKNAAYIILVHNHPSLDATPSKDDIEVTKRIARGGVTLGVALIDHVIVTDNGFSSLKALNLFDLKEVIE
ncbi:MAG: DNA repair protein RadC [Patescibacteria group bacterium]|jgi:DNA repair protein RadC